jgi:hypothetical protein
LEKNLLFKNNARAFLKLVDFRKCQEWLLKVLENSWNKLDINLFKNMLEQDEQQCNLWEIDALPTPQGTQM